MAGVFILRLMHGSVHNGKLFIVQYKAPNKQKPL